MIEIECRAEEWPIFGAFAISRESRTVAQVIVATIRDGDFVGLGECVPYRRYGETVDSVREVIRRTRLTSPDRGELRNALPPGAARNALDCALWDLHAKKSGQSVADCCGRTPLRPVMTAYTISLDTPDAMAAAATAAASRPVLKIKLGGRDDAECIAAVRKAAPRSILIVDPNEGWAESTLTANLAACADAGVVLVEQPLPAGDDGALAEIERPIPICADESAHVSSDLEALTNRYDAVNIKLDKTGGLTEALAMVNEARRLDMAVMIGCMVSTSLAVAPALILAQDADHVDLDGPLLLSRDREPALNYRNSLVDPPVASLWG